MNQVNTNTSKKIGTARLKQRRDFVRIQRGGSRFKGQFLTIMSRPKFAQSPHGLFGLVTPKAIGKANIRNLIKRRLRHIVTLVPELLNQHDVVLVASSNSLLASFDDLKSDVLKARERFHAPRAVSIRR